MRCREAREVLMQASTVPSPEVRAHLATCTVCTRFAARLAQARGQLGLKTLRVYMA